MDSQHDGTEIFGKFKTKALPRPTCFLPMARGLEIDSGFLCSERHGTLSWAQAGTVLWIFQRNDTSGEFSCGVEPPAINRFSIQMSTTYSQSIAELEHTHTPAAKKACSPSGSSGCFHAVHIIACAHAEVNRQLRKRDRAHWCAEVMLLLWLCILRHLFHNMAQADNRARALQALLPDELKPITGLSACSARSASPRRLPIEVAYDKRLMRAEANKYIRMPACRSAVQLLTRETNVSEKALS